MKCRITFQGGHGMNEDAGDRFASIVVDVPDTIAKMCNEFGASFSHVVATEWMPLPEPYKGNEE